MQPITADQDWHDGDRVYHPGWDITGTVRFVDDIHGEVRWDGVGVADELDLIADQLQVVA